jgi:hypothetical protein
MSILGNKTDQGRFDLPERCYLGPTTTDNSLAFLMVGYINESYHLFETAHFTNILYPSGKPRNDHPRGLRFRSFRRNWGTVNTSYDLWVCH